ncbi:hypothetical protein HNP71_000956 [Acidocella aromatica]|uniref:Uncharacterized protein n=1 Tax=Acidocella aromatica TaxID=1303579 RepID=A0A840VHN9_9PROT|nr:hypothetical protein [Acidocella aromatica]
MPDSGAKMSEPQTAAPATALPEYRLKVRFYDGT